MKVIHGSTCKSYPPKEVRKVVAIRKIELENMPIIDDPILFRFKLEFPFAFPENILLEARILFYDENVKHQKLDVYFERVPITNLIQIPIPKFNNNIEKVYWQFTLYIPQESAICYWNDGEYTSLTKGTRSWQIKFLTHKEEEEEDSGELRSMIFKPFASF